MSQQKKSRLRLLQLKKELEFISQGVKILMDKRDSLMKEFYSLIRKAHEARKELNENLQTAARLLSLAQGMESHRSLLTASLAAQQKIVFPVSIKNIWGVKIPMIDIPDVRRGYFERGSSPGYRNPVVDETAGRFEAVINSLTKSAATENYITVIGKAIRSTSRKVNALEQIMAPEVKAEMSRIRTHLEEISREDIFRMKRYKKLKTENK